MADDEEAARQEKLAAARKRFEELKKQQDKKPPKKKATKKGKSEGDRATTTGSETPERADSPATVAGGTETPLPPEEPGAVVEEVDDAAGATHEEEQHAAEYARPDDEFAAVIADLRARADALELENAALKDSLVTANAKIQLDATAISSLQAQVPQTPVLSPSTGPQTLPQPPMSPSKRDEYYRTLEEKFSREAQERYLLERDYASLARTHEKLVTSHSAVVVELERLKMQFSAEEKRRQTSESRAEPEIDEKQALAARERAANINARISAGTSSLFRTAQGLSAAVVKGVTGGASAVIDGGAPAMMRRVSSSKGGRLRAGSSASYADVDLYADDGALAEEDEDDEAAYQRGLERARLAAAEQRDREAKADMNAKRLQWLKNEMEKWNGFQLDLTKAGGSPAGAGPIFEV
ncbi:hypothetical protein POJ06DRAFT_95973 [Lipomyces tetrasporus]|uniref:Uncharacterized protein n=1 Tax=Lipomyces tetrasporus TaxID=54092 RepID=A0AAD7VTV6_9ASCO|nr:uncharacterized protein POJ06DRAFT_95973 [Lipomyces tetrasporus]KAJ8101396.1 hypothetical protein POJ06DRAFT_95973 [Lipomyces tetrasporus]